MNKLCPLEATLYNRLTTYQHIFIDNLIEIPKIAPSNARALATHITEVFTKIIEQIPQDKQMGPTYNMVKQLSNLYYETDVRKIRPSTYWLTQIIERGILQLKKYEIKEIIQLINLYINSSNFFRFRGIAKDIKLETNISHPMIAMDGSIYAFFPYLLQHSIEGCIADCSNFACEIMRSVSSSIPFPFATKDLHRLACILLRKQGIPFVLNKYEMELIDGYKYAVSLEVRHIYTHEEIDQTCMIVAVGPYGYKSKGYEDKENYIGHTVIYIPRLKVFIQQSNWATGISVCKAYDLSSRNQESHKRVLFAFFSF